MIVLKILITKKLPGKWHERVDLPDYQVIVKPDDQDTRDFIFQNSSDTVGILCLLTNKIDKDIIDKLPNLRIISNYAVGFDNIDVEYATKKGICVTNTPGVLTEASADLTWALILAARRLVVSADRFTRDGKFKGWEPELFLGYDVYGKTLGIIGFGRIGQAVAKRAKGFDMKILYYSRTRDLEAEKALNAGYRDLDLLLKESDIVSIHTPLNTQTYHMITYEKLKLMKPDSTIVNTARGKVIKEEDLVRALKEGLIFSAGLDVYEFEPDVHPDLLKMENVVLLPHIGSASFETRTKMAEIAVTNLVNFINNKKPVSVVNPEVLNI
ncbi:MAG: D-glycerate dehydrogenase [Candidatus Calescibacterium sp.]|nr:D-glycerate dehydrogenase [Candidatus Calescibacterium sp.]MCX7758496.1 D-glycerate dehydrogenase [bacterium]